MSSKSKVLYVLTCDSLIAGSSQRSIKINAIEISQLKLKIITLMSWNMVAWDYNELKMFLFHNNENIILFAYSLNLKSQLKS